MSLFLKKIILLTFLSMFVMQVFAPSSRTIIISDSRPYEPYRLLINAVGMVETKFDTLAYNPVEKAVGFFQIRPVRVRDYNQRTGSKYTLKDMYNYNISEKVFLYYASEIGPYDFQKIAKNWNGSGRKTKDYWKRVKKYL